MAELQKKETFTQAEWEELVQLSPPNTFWSLPNLRTIGVVDFKRAVQNLEEGADRARHAMENGCYLEVISLRLQHIEFWLRLFWVAENQKCSIFEPDDRRPFGAIVCDCARLGLCHNLVCRLKEFNKHRINAIHKWLLGATEYDDLRKVCEDSYGLDSDVGKYVKQKIGKPILDRFEPTHQDGKFGAEAGDS